jgi:hypothetical protein
VPSYLVELYQPRAGSASAAGENARVAGALATFGGHELRYVRTYVVAEDEMCFHVFEAASRDVVVEAAERAGLSDARVTEAVERAAAPRRDRNEDVLGRAGGVV